MRLPTRTTRALATAVVIVLASGSLASAQPATGDPAFARMRTKLKAGDRLTVALMNGSTVEGRLVDVGADELSITTGLGERRLPRLDVATVQRHGHGIILGSVIGAGVGLTCGVFAGMLLSSEGADADPAIFGMTLLGLGVGAGIDAVANIPRTVYQQSSPARTTFKVEAGPRRKAVRVAISF